MRYSVWTPDGGAFGTAHRAGPENYRNALFAPERMRQRLWLFEHVALYSLLRQKPGLDPSSTRLLIFTSDQLPQEDRAALDRLTAPHSWIKVIAVSDGHDMRERLPVIIADTLSRRFPDQTAVPYATLRLDDDDALAHDFLGRVRRLTGAPYAGMCLSFGRGYSAWVDETGQFTRFRELVFPNIALGLAYIGLFDTIQGTFQARYRSIMSLGRHTHVHLKAPTIVACRRPCYVRTLYEGQDSHSAGKRFYHNGALVGPDQVRRRVPLSDAMLAAYDPSIETVESAAPRRGRRMAIGV